MLTDLCDDALLHVARLLQKDPLLGLLAFVALRRTQRRLLVLFQSLPSAEAVRRASSVVRYDWFYPNFSSRASLPPDAVERSEKFSTAFGHVFKLLMFPNGNRTSEGVALYLELQEVPNLDSWRSFVRNAVFDMRVHSWDDCTPDVWRQEVSAEFSDAVTDWGFRSLLSFFDLEKYLQNDTLHLSVEVTVQPPEVTFGSLRSVLHLQKKHFHMLRCTLPSMVCDLEKVLRANHELKWLTCQRCGELMTALSMPHPKLYKTRSDRLLGAHVKCAKEGCGCCCEIEEMHAVLRKHLADFYGFLSYVPAWKSWKWPGVWRVLAPEDFEANRIMCRYKEQRSRDASDWREQVGGCSRDLDSCLKCAGI